MRRVQFRRRNQTQFRRKNQRNNNHIKNKWTQRHKRVLVVGGKLRVFGWLED